MANANINFNVTGSDKTGAAFKSVGWRAKQLSSILKGALAFTGAYFGMGAIKSGIDELGHLSDIAQKANTSVSELTKASAALSAIGIQNVGVDQLGKAFDYLQKTTGRRGFSGFLNTIEDLGKIEDTAKRGQEAVRVFGKSGMEFVPLINACEGGTAALKGVMAAFPGVSQAAADAGDGAADAMGFVGNEIKSIWLEGLGFISKKLNNDFTGDVRTAALNAGNTFTFYIKTACVKAIEWFTKVQSALKPFGEGIGAAFGTFKESAKWYDWLKLLNPATVVSDFLVKKFTGKESAITKAWDAAKEGYASGMKEAVDDFEEIEKRAKARLQKVTGDYEFRKKAITKFKKNYDDLSKGAAKNEVTSNVKVELAEKSKPTIKNDLIMAGSNEARKLQILGPSMQSEQKKTNQLLSDIKTTLKDVEGNQEKEVMAGPSVID